MSKTSKLNFYVERKEYKPAVELLKDELARAGIIDLRFDESWGPATDKIGYCILADLGTEAYCKYWEDMLTFFLEREKDWGHLHKGHIYYRMGLGYCPVDISKAELYLQEAFNEDRLFEIDYQERNRFSIPDEKAHARYPSYVALIILKLLSTYGQKAYSDIGQLYEGLAYLHIDVIWGPKEVDTDIVGSALNTLLGSDKKQTAQSIYRELNTLYALRLANATICCAADLLKLILLSRSGGADIDKPVSQLIDEIHEQQVSAKIKATFGILDCLKQSVLTPDNGGFQITPEMQRSLSVAVKILLDTAIVEWAHN